ncbi:MAG: HAMP domain-containing histidine kinase [Patescibacteria group bacterium]|nr:HAMP domain-containing histidine kinase [Patescibacteria group bacterium]
MENSGVFSRIRNLTKNSLVYAIALVFLISGFIGWFVVNSSSDRAIARTNEEIKAYTDLSTKTIVDAYTLYYSSGFYKFKEIINETLKISPNISKFQLVNPEGKVLFDSSNVGNTTEVSLDETLADSTRKISTTYVYDKKDSSRITQVISPYLEDWSRHPYSVVYYVNYEKVDSDIYSFKLQIILFVFLLSLSTALTLISTITAKDLALKKEEKQELEELNKRKDQFLMIAAHNLRTPLTSIKGFLSLITEKNKKFVQEEKEYFEPIVEGTDRLFYLTETIIEVNSILAEKVTFNFKAAEIVDIIEKEVRSCLNLATEKGIIIKFEKPKKKLPLVSVDIGKIKEVFQNLISNAIKFNKPNGWVKINIQRNENDITITVSDNGIGFKKEEQEHIFEMFHRGTDILTYNYEGVGLGLFLSKLIIDKHKGNILVESKEGKGSKFSIVLPIMSS